MCFLSFTSLIKGVRLKTPLIKGAWVGGPRTPPFGPFLCTRFRNQKSQNEIKDSKNGASEMISVPGNFGQMTEMGSVQNSFFEGHEVIWISVTRQLPGQIFCPGISDFPNFPWQLCSGGPKVGDRWGRPRYGLSGCIRTCQRRREGVIQSIVRRERVPTCSLHFVCGPPTVCFQTIRSLGPNLWSRP